MQAIRHIATVAVKPEDKKGIVVAFAGSVMHLHHTNYFSHKMEHQISWIPVIYIMPVSVIFTNHNDSCIFLANHYSEFAATVTFNFFLYLQR